MWPWCYCWFTEQWLWYCPPMGSNKVGRLTPTASSWCHLSCSQQTASSQRRCARSRWCGIFQAWRLFIKTGCSFWVWKWSQCWTSLNLQLCKKKSDCLEGNNKNCTFPMNYWSQYLKLNNTKVFRKCFFCMLWASCHRDSSYLFWRPCSVVVT